MIRPGASNEQVFQMLWDCKFCGTPKLLGLDNKFCPNCGAQQDPKWRYFPSEQDIKFVTDPAYVYAGIDVVCPYCSTPNSANANFCKQCGGDLKGGKAADLNQIVSTGFEGASGVREDLTLKDFKAQQAIKTPPKRGIPAVLLVVLALIAAGIVAFIVLSRSTYTASMQVASSSWERNIYTENFIAVPGSGWRNEVPFGAYNTSCSSRQRSYTESETYSCGYEYVDRGDGSGSRRAKTCSRSVTKYRTDSFCSYIVNTWTPGKTYSTTGGVNDPMNWPNFTPSGIAGALGASRESRREQKLLVQFTGINAEKGKSYTYNPDDASTWMTFKPGQSYSVNINRLEQVQWNTLKSLAQ